MSAAHGAEFLNETDPPRSLKPGWDAAGAVELARLAAVSRYDILDTPPDGAYDRIAALAAQLLGTPIATVTIVDSDRIWFKAAHGLDGVTQIGRDPGLCASAILADGPYLITNAATDPRSLTNPLVCGPMSVRFYAAAPIITSDGHRLGTVNVLDTRPRRLDDTQLATLTNLAAIVMDQLELRLSALTTLRHERELREQAERDTATIEEFATTLQHTLLPPSLPVVPGLDVACHYHAASPREVSGDFYDMFSLGANRWAFFVGDVQGHGAAAAAVTSLIRYTLRAAALHDPDPVAVLSVLNSALMLDEDTTRFCTVVYGTIAPDPDGISITLGSGGHPPALLLHATDTDRPGVEEIATPGGQLVGVFRDPIVTTRRIRLQPGNTLLIYTDGITEARPGGEFFGDHGLFHCAATSTDIGAAPLINRLATVINGFVPGPTDDIALLALHARKR